METKSAIAIIEGNTFKAVMCETGDYVDLAPCLQQYWRDQLRVKKLIEEGFQKSITKLENFPCEKHTPALTFFNFLDFMRYFEKFFCEDYYIMDQNVWYYASAGERSVVPLDIKIQPLLRTSQNSAAEFCTVHDY
jgi:hypothetical protein